MRLYNITHTHTHKHTYTRMKVLHLIRTDRQQFLKSMFSTPISRGEIWIENVLAIQSCCGDIIIQTDYTLQSTMDDGLAAVPHCSFNRVCNRLVGYFAAATLASSQDDISDDRHLENVNNLVMHSITAYRMHESLPCFRSNFFVGKYLNAKFLHQKIITRRMTISWCEN